MVEKVTGGCLCSAVRYVCDTAPGAAAYCHCSDCRRCTGSAFNISLPVAAAAFHVTAGAPKGYTSQADSGQALTRHFCADCGSPIYTSSAAHPDRVYLKAGSLDDATLVEPAYQGLARLDGGLGRDRPRAHRVRQGTPPMTDKQADAVHLHARAQLDHTIERLTGYLRHPAISCDQDHFDDVRRLAATIRDDLEALGFARARVLELDDALPCVAAERLDAGADKPCVLIYGHLDLQPVKGEPWDTPPHEATLKDGRLYARGSGDDMGGWLSHLAAIEAWLAVAGTLPCNVKLLIEGEEEIGSPNLERYMDAHPDAFEADVMVLTDCDNPSTEIPGLTVSLRGAMRLDVEVEALKADVHSGLWGNVVPDVSTALVKLLARLVDDDGRFALGRMDVPEAWRQGARDVPLDAEVVRAGAGLVDGVTALPERGRSLAEWAWRQSALTVLSTTLPTPDRRKNALRASAAATLSIRIAPGQTREEVRQLISDELQRDPPGGVKVTVSEHPGAADAWLYTPQGPAFAAADRAYTKAWGRPLLHVGIGGSIPFVALFGRRYGHLPLILNGVLDPASGIHGPNESMHLGVFEKAIAANVHLLDELGALSRAELA